MTHIRPIALLWLAVLPLLASDAPPLAKKVPKELVNHGDKRVDDYFWLRDRKDPDVVAYLEAENKYTEARMKHTEELQKRLYDEILGRIKETDLSVPEKIDRYLYYSRTEKGKQYPIYCRKEDRADAKEEVLLEVNELAKGHKYYRIGAFDVSPDHRLLAYSFDTNGSEIYMLRVKELATGQLLKDEIPNTYYSVEWANDNRTLFYNTLDKAHRPFEIRSHVLGTDAKDDKIVFQEPEEKYTVQISKTRSRAYLMLGISSTTSSEFRYLPADKPEGEFRVLEPRRKDVLYGVDHHSDHFYIRTNEGDAKNFKLMKAPVTDPSRKNWREVMPHNRAVMIEFVAAFRDHLVVARRVKGLRQVRVIHLATGKEHDIEFPEPVYTVFPARNPEFNTTTLRFSYMSLVTPQSVYDYDMDARTRVLKKQYEVLGGYDPGRYQSERIFAKAADGVEVPISLVYRKGMERNGKNPLLLYGYGSYGSPTEPFFSSDRLSLLDRGFIYALAHIRGSSDLGRYWYEDGKLLKKKNTFTDFIACAEHLVKEKYTSPDRLAAMGGSAGGLLMGAVVNLRPDLFRAVIAKVPFVDVINTMLDASIPLTAQEFEEWGNPAEKKYYDYMKSYSPYDNVAAKNYPHLLVTTGLNDPRVAYWEPAKWTARLRTLKTDNHLLILKTNLGAGHGGPSGRYERIKETAFDYAFLLDRLEVVK